MNYYFILIAEIASVVLLFQIINTYEKKFFNIVMKDYQELKQKLIPCICNPLIFKNKVSDKEYVELENIFDKYKKIEKIILVIVFLSLLINSLFVKCYLY